jgi:hypothetical protein
VLTGLPPSVFEEDPVFFEALEAAAIRQQTRWTRQDEFNASTLEMLHSLYLLTARANGAKNVGQPLRIPRPGDEEKKAAPMSPREFALMSRR